MNLIQKITPKGIDKVIDDIQNLLNTELLWSDFNCYPRIYKEETEQGIKPMNYVGNGDYRDVFFNDNIDGSCFFYPEDKRTGVNGYFTNVKLSIVFQIKLNKLYPIITHRADEESHNDVILALRKKGQYELIELVVGYKNVYSEFDTSLVKYDDISDYHVFRVDLNVSVNNNCK